MNFIKINKLFLIFYYLEFKSLKKFNLIIFLVLN